MTILSGNCHVSGVLSADTLLISDDSVDRDMLLPETQVEYPINFTDFRVHDALQTNLPGTSAADDLGLVPGTFGTNAPKLRTYDVKAAGALSIYARVVFALPAEYDTAGGCTVRVRCGMITNPADVSCTVDIEAYRLDEDGAVSADLCVTAAQSMNSLSKANKDFSITATTLTPGDMLDVRVKVATNDAATGTAVIAELSKISFLLDIRG